ncbi:MAG: hypothetical protein QOI35_3024 [Cryptosporangiaceae bacterium]|nr:hypothetical protein [Cryptosporangiaceae bacterium]
MADRRRRVLWLTLALVAALVVVGIGGFVAVGGRSGMAAIGAGRGLWVASIPGSPAFGDPRQVLAPDGQAAGASESGVSQAVTPLLADKRLGNVALSVIDLESGKALFGRRDTEAVTPASTTKIVTAAAALAALGPYHRFTTAVVAGPGAGEVVLVGGGDPTLAVGPNATYAGAARLDTLAKQVTAKGKVTKLIYDTSLFTGPALAPGWDSDTVSGGSGSPVSALAVDGGRKKPAADPESETPGIRSADPAKDAAVKFGKLLGLGPGQVVAGTATAGAQPIASLPSPPVQWLVDQMLGFSDNVIAEALLRQVAIAKKQPATFTGGAAARHQVLQELGVDVAGDQLQDGSGLSRLDKLTPQFLTGVLKAAVSPDHAGLRGIVSGLPVAGYSGTLATRFGSDAAAAGIGEVRAKTGTLSGVDALAGVVMTKDGTQLAFALVANGTAGSARPVMDKLAAKLAACGCA